MTVLDLGMPRVRPDRPPAPAGRILADELPARPASGELVDRFGRVARDLRISVTTACSLRCTYCMPAEGLPVPPRDELLSAAEIARLVGIAVHRLGVREVRFTGGEPLTRGDLVEIVRRSAQAAPGIPLALTTNGIGLDRRAGSLREAGLTRVNVSLDTVDREHFARLTRRDRLPAVLAGIAAAAEAGLAPLKVNAVLMRETLADAPELLAWAIAHGARLRFIEQMPLDADAAWARDRMVPASELLALLAERFALAPAGRDDPAAPAEEWIVDGGPTTVGIIASVTRSFCGACDRTRLTAEGTVRSCLFGDDETELRGLLRGGGSDEELAEAWRTAMWGKRAGHGIDDPGFLRPLRTMGGIGG